MEAKKCEVCGKPVKRNAIKYCSITCQQTDYWAERKKHFEQTGEWKSYNGAAKCDDSLRGNYKHYLLDMRGHRCENCGLEKWQDKEIPLVLDHISGHVEDWSLENLRLICPNCDAQTPTFAGRNRGSGRKWRRDRYAKFGCC